VAANLAPHASACFAKRDAQATPLRYFAALTKINARLAATAAAMTYGHDPYPLVVRRLPRRAAASLPAGVSCRF